MIQKIDGLWDSHHPHEISMTPLLDYLKDRKPNIFIFGGDNWSMDIISHWNSASFRLKGITNVMRALKKEAASMNNVLDMFREACGSQCVFYYIVGNHEVWLDRFKQDYPQVEDISLSTFLNLKKRSFKVVPFGGTLKLGKLYCKHGHEFGGSNPAKQAVERSKHSIVFGHHHTLKMWQDYSWLEASDKHVGIQVPCYCKLNPDYGRGSPNAWTNGFFWANMKKSGRFCAGVQNVSPEGRFITQEGREYA